MKLSVDTQALRVESEPELSFEISESAMSLDEIIENVHKVCPGWTFDRTESRYESCVVAIFVPVSM